MNFDELYGKTGGNSDKRWIKFENEGDTFLLEQIDEPKLVTQKNQKTGKDKWLVQVNESDKYKVMDEGDFDPDEVHNSFMPDKDIEIPVRVLGKKLPNGDKVEDFEPFDATWELRNGDMQDKHMEAMMETRAAAEKGARYTVTLLSKSVKPYKYSVRMKAAE
jgi:hypothetical protein